MTEHSFPHLLISLVALLIATKLLGVLAQRIKQPAVVGELIAGVLGIKPRDVQHPFEHRAHVLKGISCLECHASIREAKHEKHELDRHRPPMLEPV